MTRDHTHGLDADHETHTTPFQVALCGDFGYAAVEAPVKMSSNLQLSIDAWWPHLLV